MAGISKKKVKTKNGVKIKYTITYRDIYGKQHTTGLYDTIKEAKKDLPAFEHKKPGALTYGDIFSCFLEKVKTRNAPGTYANYKMYHTNYLARYDRFNYDKIKSLEWQKIFTELERDSGPYVAQHCLKFAKAAVNWQIKHESLDNNVFNKIEAVKIPKADINHLNIDELKQVLAMCKKVYPQYYALIYTFIGTGAREGEIFALEKKDFDPRENKIIVNKQFTKGKLYLHPKTATSNRDIYMFDDLAAVLDEHIKKLKPDCQLLFPNKIGGYMSADNFRRRVFYRILQLCGITKRVRLHDLRGSYTDLTLCAGLSVKFTQNQLGHAKAETTTNIYMRNNSDMIQAAVNNLDIIFKNKKCENNVRIKDDTQNNKIIQFPKIHANRG